MKNRLLVPLMLLLALCGSISLQSQLLNNAYFLENVPGRHFYNPAFQPVNTFYIGIPLLNNNQFSYVSGLPTLKDAGFSPWQRLMLDRDKAQIINALPDRSLLNSSASLSLFDLGFRYNANYWTFSLTHKLNVDGVLPSGLFKTLLNGPDFSEGSHLYLADSYLNSQQFTEGALGYSRAVSDRFSFGAKLKLLYGHHQAAITTSENSIISTNSAGVNAMADMRIDKTAPFHFTDRLGITKPASWFDYLKPYGAGAAIDLGIDWKPLKPVSFSLAVTNLGMMYWRGGQRADYQLGYQFDDTKTNDWLANHPGFTEVPADSILNEFRNNLSVNRTAVPGFRRLLTPTLNASLEIDIIRQWLSVGVLSRTSYSNRRIYEDLTAAVNFRPANWMNLSLSYSVFEGNMSNLGLGASARLGSVNIFLSADYVPVRYNIIRVNEYLPKLPDIPFPVGFDTDRISVSAGVSLVFGTRKDSDRDGISDRFDRCPYTPAGVIVDRHGCPLDSDNDGVPDYLDNCPHTPKEAIGFIGPDGCMLDTDGDGIPDYLDRCPDSPVGAYGHVDVHGCPVDTDGDGVLDYMDKCPGTPDGIEVDENGCPIDTDGDGVPDYLDLCPNTPLEARGYVDVNGCLLDTDDDGVPDYLDLCPETPIEARGFVDINGCLIDADDDGVPDFRDDCLNTPFAARGLVNARGCPRDTDGDGVPDYLDDCPNVPGLKENNGCPEVKAEVKSLLFRAIQGIRFERDSIKMQDPSYEILDEIAAMMKENPIYQLEIHGHTDNQARRQLLERKGIKPNITEGMSQARQDAAIKQQISDEYAKLVRNYLYIRGVEYNRMHVKGMSDSKPIAGNNTEAGRIRNSRIEMFVVFQEVSKE
jgi:outer membrane protein OmpA-like peptidoglycan-associated protein